MMGVSEHNPIISQEVKTQMLRAVSNDNKKLLLVLLQEFSVFPSGNVLFTIKYGSIKWVMTYL
jgi:hypothetical protein